MFRITQKRITNRRSDTYRKVHREMSRPITVREMVYDVPWGRTRRAGCHCFQEMRRRAQDCQGGRQTLGWTRTWSCWSYRRRQPARQGGGGASVQSTSPTEAAWTTVTRYLTASSRAGSPLHGPRLRWVRVQVAVTVRSLRLRWVGGDRLGRPWWLAIEWRNSVVEW